MRGAFLVYVVMSTPPGKQQQQQRQRGGGAGGRGQSTTPGHGIGKGGAQQAPRGRRGRKSGKKPASPQSTGEPRTAGVPSPSSASGVKKETSSQPKAGASLSSVKTGKPSDAPTSAASRQLAGTNDTCASREGPQQESMSLSLQPTKQQETSLFSVPSPVLDATSPSIETTLPLLTSHLKEKGAEDGSVSLSEVKLDDYGVARRLLNFTRGPGDCESEGEDDRRGRCVWVLVWERGRVRVGEVCGCWCGREGGCWEGRGSVK